MSRRTWAWLRLVGGAAILAVIVWRVGTGPIVDGIRTISVGSVAAAVVLTAITTVAAAYRWSVVANGLGVGIGLRAGDRCVLPLAVPEHGVARGRARRRAPRGAPWARRGRRQPRRACGRLGALRRPGRPTRAGNRRAAARALAGARGRAARARGSRAGGGRPCRARILAAAVVACGSGHPGRRPQRTVGAAQVAAHQRVVDRRRGRTHGDLRDRGTRGRRRRVVRPPAAAGAADPARHGRAHKHRRLGPARGRGGVVVRRCRPGCRGGRRSGNGVRRARPASRACRVRSSWSSSGRGTRNRPPSSRTNACRSERAVADRPYTLLSCSMSIDGYLDSAGAARLRLSNDEDFDRVDAVRASSDAILVGAGTVRNDNPRLLVKSAARREARCAQGRAPSPTKVTVTAGGGLDPAASFFAVGDAPKLVYCTSAAAADLHQRRGRARHRDRQRRVRRHAADQRGPALAWHRTADGRGRRHRAHPVPLARTSGRVAAGRCSVLRR